MTELLRFTADATDSGKRADVVVTSRLPELSRSLVHRLFTEGLVHVGDAAARPGRYLKPGDEVEVVLRLPASMSAEPQNIPLRIVYEDSDLAIVDKPAGLTVHPAPGHSSGTLANALVARYPWAAGVGASGRPGIVHRLDKDTSGLMVVALTPRAHASLQQQIAQRSAEREYLALVTGELRPVKGTIDAPIGRDPTNRKRMAVHGVASRPARTSFEAIEFLSGVTLVQARLHTGRTHQIRAHFAAIRHPVAGDKVYRGRSFPGLTRQFLHAYRLTVRSPSTDAPLTFESPLPPELEAILLRLRAAQ